jgi:predicted RND superfamily exporter protein
MSDIATQVGDFLTTYTKSIIVVVLLLTVAIGAGVGNLEQQSNTGQFESDSAAADAQAYVSENFSSGGSSGIAIVQIIQRGDDVLTEESLVESLSLQQEILDRESVRDTLVNNTPVFGVSNVIATAAYRQQGNTGEPTLAEQKNAIRSLNESQLDTLVQNVLGEDGNEQALGLMPSSFTPGSTSAGSFAVVVRQQTDADVQNPSNFPDELTDAQLEIREITQDRSAEYALFGSGLLGEEIGQSLSDSGALVGPFALLFVVVALTIAYRDLLDIVLGVLGIVAVLVWTFGFMGWTGVPFNQLLLAVPVLLIGLSIDYAIHVFMRYREQRAEGDSLSVRRGMSFALAGVGVALVWVTATGALGFLANLISPIGALQDFGIVSAFGIAAALIIYGTLIPALKIEIDGFLEARGFSREKRAFATGGGTFSRVLAGGASAARRFPVVVVAVALLLSLGGAYGATQVDTSFDETDFLADSPPEWTQSLPEPLAPGTYQVSQDLEFIGDSYQQEGSQADVLIRGEVTSDRTLRRLAAVEDEAAGLETVFVGPTGPNIRSPLTVMRETAARGNQIAGATPPSQRTEQQTALVEFAEEYESATAESGDGVPSGDVERLYDLLLRANPQATQFIYRTDGGYEAIRLAFGVAGDARIGAVADDTRAVADIIETESDEALTAAPAGDQVVFDNVQKDLLSTVTQGLIITLVSVFLFLSIAYRVTGNRASLGFVTMIPVMLAVTWILGSMWLLDIPFNTLTGTITSLTVGLGIAYSIHISSRYELELRRQGDVWAAMRTTVTGTGGALLGSAATTVGGFGTLALAILPILQQFGIITGLTIIYAFLASVLVLPSLLALWTRYFGPSGYFPGDEDDPEEPAIEDDAGEPAADGGQRRG